MKQSTFTQARMAFDTTAPLEEVCRKVGMFEAAFYAWRHEGNRIAVRYAYEWRDGAVASEAAHEKRPFLR